MDKLSTTNTRPSRQGFEKLAAMTGKSIGSGVFYLGLHNLLNGYVSNLFIGENEMVRTVMERQRRYLERVMGWVVQHEKEDYLTFSFSTSGDPVMTISMIELDRSGAKRYFDLKHQAQQKDMPFFGIVSHDVGQTDILHPIDPDTGQLRFPVDDDEPRKRNP